MTMIRFGGGGVIEVSLSLREVRELLQKALAKHTMVELEGPDGETVVINPQQVQYLQNSGDPEPFPGSQVSGSITASA
jgi:Protein of unknown function (DUF3107)